MNRGRHRSAFRIGGPGNWHLHCRFVVKRADNGSSVGLVFCQHGVCAVGIGGARGLGVSGLAGWPALMETGFIWIEDRQSSLKNEARRIAPATSGVVTH